MNKYKKLSINVLLFSISSFGQKVLAFLLIPLYTSYLTSSQYGTIDLITTTTNLIVPIMTLNIAEAVMRFTIDDKDNDNYLSYGVLVLLKGSAILAFILFVFYMLPFALDYKRFYPLIFIVFFISAIYSLFQNYLRAVDQVSLMVMSSLFNSAVMLILDVIFISQMNLGVAGYYLAMLSGLILSISFMIIKGGLFRHISLNKIEKGRYRSECLRYAIPTVFTALAWWINSSLDRYFVVGMLGVSQNGVYSIAYKIPTILGVFQTIFTQAWTLSAISDFDKNDTDGFFGNTYMLFNSVMVLGTALIMLFNNLFAKILYAKDFYIAWKYVPLLLVASLFSALSGYLGSIFAAAKDTKTCAYSTIISAFINIILNAMLIPRFGIYGAAIATVISYITAWLIRIVVSRKYIKMKVKLTKDLLAYVLVFVQMVLAMTPTRIYVGQVVVVAVLVILYSKQYKIAIYQLLRKIFRKSED